MRKNILIPEEMFVKLVNYFLMEDVALEKEISIFLKKASPYFIFGNMHKNGTAFLYEITKPFFAKKTCILPEIQLIYKKTT